VKINTVALQSNAHEIPDMMRWAHGLGMDMTLIEVMPLGEIDGDRVDQYIPLSEVRDSLANEFTLTQNTLQTGGPARYVSVQETGGTLLPRSLIISALAVTACASPALAKSMPA